MKFKRICCVVMAALMMISGMTVYATKASEIQSQKTQNEKALKDVQSKISNLESQRSSLSSEVNSLNDSLTDTLLNIEVLESDLADKEVEIEQAQEDYEAAKATEDKQYASMKTRIQYLYESGETSYVELLLTSEDVGDLINKVDYAEELQESDRRLLDQYKAAKEAVVELQQQLAEEKEELQEMEAQLEEEKANLESVIAQKKSEIADFDSQLSTAKAKASEYQKKIKEQNAQIKKLQQQEAAAARAAASASSKGSNSGSSSSGSSKSTVTTATVSGGSGTGAAIASYGLQFVGYPYVRGGNSLTNGTDCSGFVNLIHAHFGISTPRQSGALAGAGRAVSDADKLPGDVVCYYGHVGIYIGNNQIVHASTEKTGIKVSNMYYRSISCIRRYW